MKFRKQGGQPEAETPPGYAAPGEQKAQVSVPPLQTEAGDGRKGGKNRGKHQVIGADPSQKQVVIGEQKPAADLLRWIRQGQFQNCDTAAGVHTALCGEAQHPEKQRRRPEICIGHRPVQVGFQQVKEFHSSHLGWLSRI